MWAVCLIFVLLLFFNVSGWIHHIARIPRIKRCSSELHTDPDVTNIPVEDGQRPRRVTRQVQSHIFCVSYPARIILNVICDIRQIVVNDPFAAKAALVRSIAARVVAGEFSGSARIAARDPECVALGILYFHINYHIGLINPAGGLARAADRARVETEVAAAAVALHEVQYVFVERKGAAPAAAAVSRIVDKLESQLGAQVGNVAKMARRDASASSQVEIETAATEIEALVDELRQMKKRAADAAADAKQQIVALEAKLASFAGNTEAAVTNITVRREMEIVLL